MHAMQPHHKPKFEMTRDTSSTGSSSSPIPERPMCPPKPEPEAPVTALREPPGGPYTLGNSGAVADVGLDVPPVPVPVTDVSGDSGRESPEPRGASLMRVSENVKSSDCARLVRDRGFVSWSFNFASRRESDPRLSASSAV